MRPYEEFLNDLINAAATRSAIAARSVEDCDCIRWTGFCFNGHPAVSVHGTKMLVRRALWTLAGKDIRAGHVLRCQCEVERCINLEHIAPMTYRRIAQIEGARGSMSGPSRSAKIAATKRAGKQARITQAQAREIRSSDESSTVLSERFGLAVATVCKIKRGEVRREFAGNVWAGLSA